MNRIERIFADLRKSGARVGRTTKALMPFVTAGDPDLATTAAILPAMQQAGASICELGIAFSDPIADGPVIQASMTRALEAGVRPRQVLEMVAAQRAKLDIGLVAMVSYSIVHRLEPATFIRDAAQAGIDGFIIPDLPLEESGAVRELVEKHDLILSFLISPTTPPQRAQRIAKASSGFVYVLARAGVTGERAALPADLSQRIEQLREATDLPMAVGFGVSDAAQVRQVVEVADAAIVGSAIMRRVAEHRQDGPQAIAGQVGEFVAQLAQGLTPAPAASESR